MPPIIALLLLSSSLEIALIIVGGFGLDVGLYVIVLSGDVTIEASDGDCVGALVFGGVVGEPVGATDRNGTDVGSNRKDTGAREGESVGRKVGWIVVG